jgi:uncharacterized protein (TIRG00374 family)
VLALLGGALALLVVVVLIHPAALLAAVRDANPETVLAALLLNLPVLALRMTRAQLILRCLGQRVASGSLLASQLVGQTSSALTPAASGDFVRAWVWNRNDGVAPPAGIATVAFERGFSFMLMVAVAALLVALPRHGAVGWALAGVGLAVSSMLPWLLSRTPAETETRLLAWALRGPTARFGEPLLDVLQQVRVLVATPWLLASASAATVLILASSGLQVWLLAAGIGHPVRITQAVAVYTSSQVVGIVSTLPFGIGPGDLLVVGSLALYGVGVAVATAIALLMRAIVTIPMAVAALPAYLVVSRRRPAPATLVPRPVQSS